jgi:hypothetical protein
MSLHEQEVRDSGGGCIGGPLLILGEFVGTSKNPILSKVGLSLKRLDKTWTQHLSEATFVTQPFLSIQRVLVAALPEPTNPSCRPHRPQTMPGAAGYGSYSSVQSLPALCQDRSFAPASRPSRSVQQRDARPEHAPVSSTRVWVHDSRDGSVCACAPASEFSFDHVLERRVLLRQIRVHALEAAVLLLKLPAHILDVAASFRLFERGNDLGLGKTSLVHLRPPRLRVPEDPQSSMDLLSGKGTREGTHIVSVNFTFTGG